jgi:hypothetical protein
MRLERDDDVITGKKWESYDFFSSLALQLPWALASSFSFMIIIQTVGPLVE